MNRRSVRNLRKRGPIRNATPGLDPGLRRSLGRGMTQSTPSGPRLWTLARHKRKQRTCATESVPCAYAIVQPAWRRQRWTITSFCWRTRCPPRMTASTSRLHMQARRMSCPAPTCPRRSALAIRTFAPRASSLRQEVSAPWGESGRAATQRSAVRTASEIAYLLRRGRMASQRARSASLTDAPGPAPSPVVL
jgi:hypothetical protein